MTGVRPMRNADCGLRIGNGDWLRFRRFFRNRCLSPFPKGGSRGSTPTPEAQSAIRNPLKRGPDRGPQSAVGESGQVQFLFIFGALALASVAFLVLNTGELASRRIRLQNGADAAAHAAATWTARGLNLVSADNVSTTQLIALAVLIDSLDVYCDAALNRPNQPGETIPQVQAIACRRLKYANWPPLVFYGHQWSQRAFREQAFLTVLRDVVTDMVAAFHPTQPDDPNSLWQMMYMLEAMSDMVVAATPATAQERAVALGKAHEADGAFAWPYWTPLPVVKGAFQDLRIPTDLGTRCPLPGPPKCGYHDLMGYYYNEGPFRWLRRSASEMLAMGGGHFINDWSSRNASVNFVSLAAISNTKFNMLFNGTNTGTYQYTEQFSQYPPPPEVAQDPTGRTVWWWEDVHSLFPMPNIIMQPSAYAAYAYVPINFIPVPPTWTIHTISGGVQFNDGMTRAADWVPDGPGVTDGRGMPYTPVPGAQLTWEGYTPFQKDFYPTLGIGTWGPGNVPIPGPLTTIYHHERVIYRHSTRARLMTFANPIYRRQVLPRPYLLDSTWDQMDDVLLAQRYSWLGFAYRAGESRVWPQWFINPIPGDNMIAVARARLYNPTAWDLFAQDWRVLMVPVGSMPEWLSGTAGLPDPAQLGGILSAADVDPVARFYRAVPPDLHDALENGGSGGAAP